MDSERPLEAPRPRSLRSAAYADDRPFVRRLLLLMLAAALAFAAWKLSDVILLVFGAILLAILLRGLARTVGRWIHIPAAWAVLPVVASMLAAFAAIAWLFGSQVAMQFDVLAQNLPQSAARLLREIRANSWGAWMLDYAAGMDLSGATQPMAGSIADFLGSAFRAVAYLAVLAFSAVYLAARPEGYRMGLLRLVPAVHRARIDEMLALIESTLLRWLVGQSVTMAVVGIFTGTGLWLLGVGAPVALGLIAGMLAFVPYAGPVLSSAPGLLMAATQGPRLTLYALALYVTVHFIEGNLITPFVQNRAVELLPVLTLVSTLVFGILFGTIGVFLAAPLTLLFLVVVNAMYLEDVLGEPRIWPPIHEGTVDG